MRAFVCVYIKMEVAHAHAQNAPLECFRQHPGNRSRAEIVERDLLVAYPVIDIRAIRYAVRISYASDQMGDRNTDILEYLI